MVIITLSNSELESYWVPKNGVIMMVFVLCWAIYLFVFNEWKTLVVAKSL